MDCIPVEIRQRVLHLAASLTSGPKSDIGIPDTDLSEDEMNIANRMVQCKLARWDWNPAKRARLLKALPELFNVLQIA